MDAERNDGEVATIDRETEKKIEKRVKRILAKANLYEITEFKIQKAASEKLGLDVSQPPYKFVVRRVVEEFLQLLKNNTQTKR
ncbi:mediator-associated protein 3-like [Tripterygium wilfordii]|uniref:Mediator-associated protein 3-like n=1 Tax=Tripterygium wilfordii TaxID=458696 RepID=A0A7J7CJW4_TRIWF|nr:mediator-associated protein 3 [Tripterygium wilfordii]KAF5734339.1 mediator-associated protein 3-like [Tripterygium wilfordii]